MAGGGVQWAMSFVFCVFFCRDFDKKKILGYLTKLVLPAMYQNLSFGWICQKSYVLSKIFKKNIVISQPFYFKMKIKNCETESIQLCLRF